jgi:hypothetical protein
MVLSFVKILFICDFNDAALPSTGEIKIAAMHDERHLAPGWGRRGRCHSL